MIDFLIELYKDGRLNELKDGTSLKYSIIEKSFVVRANDAFYSLNTSSIVEALDKFYKKEILSCSKTKRLFSWMIQKRTEVKG